MRCRRCGSLMEEDDRYCEVCGASMAPGRHAANGTAGTATNRESAASRWTALNVTAAARRTCPGAQTRRVGEPIEKLAYELAYSGVLFWVPLIMCPGERTARFCANQGVWALLLAAVACALISLFGAAEAALASGIMGVVFSGIHTIAWVVFLTFMGMLACRCTQSAMAIHRSNRFASIWFFDDIRIIKEA